MMKIMIRTVPLALVSALFLFLTPVTCYGGGITIVTHGYAMSGLDTQAWINDYANTIAVRSGFPSSTAVYEINITQQVLGPGTVVNEISSVSWLSGPADVFSQSVNGEIIFKVNWSDCATQIASGLAVSSTTIAQLLVDYFINTKVSAHSWIEQPIHLIGHSRGGSVCSEMACMFGSYGIWVDQQTTLDPHPVNNDGNNSADLPYFTNPDFSDASVRVYENTVFSDNYWENTWTWFYTPIPVYGATYPAGKAITGALNLNLNTRFEADSLADGLSADHSRVVDWYYGTISLPATTLLSDADHSIPRSVWYTSGENGGANCGYIYSRIAGGTRPSDGLNWRFGGNTFGQPITRNTAVGSQWPNVFALKVDDTRFTSQAIPEFQIGETLNLQFQYQSCDSQAYASLYLDTDQNPYNGNSVDILGSLISCSATGGNQVLAKNPQWNTSGCSSGYYYLYVKIEDGFGHVRYVYAPKQIRLLVSDVTVTFDARGGTACSQRTYTLNSPYGTLPSPTRSGYTFGGWWSGIRGSGVQITSSSTVSASYTTLYAKWIDRAAANYNYTVNSEMATITGYKGSGGTVSIPETLDDYPVTSIGSSAFAYCSSLNSITIPDSVTSIGGSAFAYCSNLISITIPDSVTSLGLTPFNGCSKLTSITVDADNQVYSSLDGLVYDRGQRTLILCPVGRIGSVAIPYNTTDIGPGAFYYCSGLTEITIPSSVTSIGQQAFYHCTGLTSVTIPNSVTSLGTQVFQSCTNLANAVIGTGVTSFGYNTFYGCSSLTSIAMPNSVTNISNLAFAYCSSLTSITIPDSVTSIGLDMFHSCSKLTSITVGAGNQTYSSLEGIVYDRGQRTLILWPVGRIGRVSIPYNITAIGAGAFYGCSGLTDIFIPSCVTNIGLSSFTACENLLNIYIPGSVISIEDNAFEKCTRLASVVFGNGLTTIGNNVFRGCINLSSVIFPASVTYIGSYTFSGCTKLKHIFFEGDIPIANSSSLYSPATIYYLPYTTGWGTSFGGRPALCWNPQVQHDANFGFTSNRFGFNIAGTTNIPVVVEACTNLSSGIWVPLTNTTLGTSGSLFFSDPSSTNAPARFYRIVWP